MSDWQFWFLVALICSVGATIYESFTVLFNRTKGTDDPPKWIGYLAAVIVMALNVAVAAIVASVAT